MFTQAFSGKLARGINNTFISALQEDKIIPAYPLQHYLTLDIRQAAAKQGRSDYLSMWAGQGIGSLRDPEPAKMIIDKLKAVCKID